MALVGAPTKYRKDFHPKDFIRLSKIGKTFAQIALEWDIDRETLWSWGKKHQEFSNAIIKGRHLAEAWYMDIGRSAMLGEIKIELGFFVWMTKNMFKWSDQKKMEDHTEQPRRLAHLTDEELDEA